MTNSAQPQPDPYRIWLSEIMLQQTTVAAVIPYFERFTQRWPTVQHLAGADDADVMAAWAGLGYYARARNLLACARQVASVHDGIFPADEAGLLTLPGVGAYTAAAISAIAFDRRAVVVDANVERVIARVFAISEQLPAGKKAIRRCTDAVTPAKNAGDFAQAMMDLGATICTSRAPDCGACPVSQFCCALAAGKPMAYPVKALKKPRPERQGRVYWIASDGHVLLVQRDAKGMLGGLRGLPDNGWSAKSNGHDAPPINGPWRIETRTIRHIFTHFALTLEIAVYEGPDFDMVRDRNLNGQNRFKGAQFWPLDDLAKAGLPTLFAKAAALMLEIDDG